MDNDKSVVENDDDIKNLSENIVKEFNESMALEDDKIAIDESMLDEDNENEEEGEQEDTKDSIAAAGEKKKKKRIVLISVGSLAIAFILTIVVVLGTRSGRKALYGMCSEILSSRLDVVKAEQNEDNILFTAPTIDVKKPEESSPYRKEDYVANILLTGIEEIKGGARSDTIIIASINIKDNTIKLTSIMRDCYVPIEGHGSNKINAAYSFGGCDLLIKTIEENFKIKIDGYAIVNFNSFEKIVDMLDGVDIELGKTEAAYLNDNNYISDPSNRHVKAGWNKLNGNQALGYARVRYVATLGGVSNDQGRTLRQRKLLNAIFDKYKSKNFIELVSIMYDILPEIKTNLTTSQISDIIEQVVENSITTIDSYQIPAEGHYENAEYKCGKVLDIDFDSNVKLLYQYIFLDEPEQIVEK